VASIREDIGQSRIEDSRVRHKNVVEGQESTNCVVRNDL
jgi:hypothetical protein